MVLAFMSSDRHTSLSLFTRSRQGRMLVSEDRLVTPEYITGSRKNAEIARGPMTAVIVDLQLVIEPNLRPAHSRTQDTDTDTDTDRDIAKDKTR